MLGQATDEAICEVRWLSATVKHSDDVEGIFLGAISTRESRYRCKETTFVSE